MALQEIRTYEISVWTLQDDFITVLKPAHTENKGQVQEPKMTLSIDGTRNLEFKIPIYIYDLGRRIENPIWYTTQEGIFIENLRKIKVIFNKDTDEERIFEFIITKVEDEHTNQELYCNVTCEGLAFNELGKVGYKISLSSEDFYNKYDEWFFDEDINKGDEPIANIDYWLGQFLKPLPTTGYINPAEWYYTIEMDWGSYPPSENRQPNKIYDDAYIGSWDITKSGGIPTGITPNDVVAAQEKCRLMDIEESNIYNITQSLAETFGVFCRYEYEHDKSYHITARKIIFYNHFFFENDGYLDITYPYSTSSIKRTIESGDLVTKMFVKPLDSASSASNLITIMDVPANKSKEDYLLNFDYLHDINTISEEQYNEIPKYEAKMRDYNTQLMSLEQQIMDVSEKITPLRAQKTVLENSINLDKERLSAANDLLNSIIDRSNDQADPVDGMIHITADAPDTGVLLYDKDNDSYYIKMSRQGVDKGSIKVYRKCTVKPIEEGSTTYHKVLEEELTTLIIETDDFGEVIKLTNLYKDPLVETNVVYLTYNYAPQLYYDRIIETWTNRLAKDETELSIVSEQLEAAEESYEELTTNYEELLSDKMDEVHHFERIMGPALREGYWQPENFKDYGDHYQDTWANIVDVVGHTDSSSGNFIPDPIFGSIDSEGTMDYFLWDTEPFYDEQKSYYTIGVDERKQYYPCVELPEGILTNNIETNINRLKQLSFLFYDYITSDEQAYADGRRRIYTVGSESQLGFTIKTVNGGKQVVPVLILTGADSLTDEQLRLEAYKNNARLGNITALETLDNTPSLTRWTVPNDQDYEGGARLTFISQADLVYPRIVIKSMSMKKDSDKLSVGFNMNGLKQYEDYYITSKIVIENNEPVPCYFITFKPEALLRQGGLDKSMSISYIISNADISIYLDALKVLKENAYPKVSYQIDVNLVDKTIMRQAYNLLSHLVHINDLDLKFNNVRGYISKVTLDLDKPWEDKYEIKNYRNKFEDLFSSIVAQTAAMQSSEGLIDLVADSFTTNGEINPDMFQNSLRKIDLNYAFNHGKLTIDEENGIWGVSEAGVVAYRGGGIFTATSKDRNGNWIWNTGIVPQGINADLITTGQLDTNRIMVYAGDKLRFQLNGDGLFAYKSFFEDLTDLSNRILVPSMVTEVNNRLRAGLDVDSRQFVKMDANGLFFIVKEDALILNKNKTGYITIDGTKKDAFGYPQKVIFTKNEQSIQVYNENGIPYHSTTDIPQNDEVWIYDDNNRLVKYEKEEGETLSFQAQSYGTFEVPAEGIKRVSISWDGFSLKNYNDEQVLYADADTGNLYIKGRLVADSVYISNGEGVNETLTVLPKYLDNNFEDHVKVSENLAAIFNEAGEVLETGLSAIQDLEDLTITNQAILSQFYSKFLDGLKDDRTIELYGSSSVDIYTGTADDPTTFSVFSLSANKGVWIGSNKAINLFANDINSQTTAAGASVSINPNYILFGVNSTGSTTAVKMTKNLIVLAAANQIDAAEIATPSTITNSNVSGLKITPDALWLATGSGNSRSLVSMQPQGITIGVATLDNSGSFIKLTKEELSFGAASNLYINATNVVLDTKPLASGQTEKTMFRLGPANDYGLLFDGTNLYIKGRLFANGTYIIDNNGTVYSFDSYLDSHFETSTEITTKLTDAFNKAGEILKAGLNSLSAIDNIVMTNFEYLNTFKSDVKALMTPVISKGPYHKALFKAGDIWEYVAYNSSKGSNLEANGDPKSTNPYASDTVSSVYVATASWNELYVNETAAKDSTALASKNGWSRTKDGTLAAIKGAKLDIDTEAGMVEIIAGQSITFKSGGKINLAANTDVNIVGNENVNIGGAIINIASSDTSISNLGGIHLVAAKYDGTSISNNYGTSTVDIDARGIKLASKEGIEITSGAGITIKSTDVNRVTVVKIDKDTGLYMGSNETITLFSGQGVPSDGTGAAVELSKDRLILGVSQIGQEASVIEMTRQHIIAGVGSESTNTDNLRNNGITLTNAVTGLKITRDGFGFAAEKTVSNVTTRSVVLIDGDGISVGSGSNPTSTGSIIRIAPDELYLGSSADLHINTNNFKVSTDATGATGVVFGLGNDLNGNNPDYKLQFVNGNLNIKGNIVASSFTLAPNTKIVQDGVSYDLSEAGGGHWYSGSAITGTSTTPTSYSTGITNACVGDMYLNTNSSSASYNNTYRCTVSGDASTAKWIYASNIQGDSGEGSKWYTGTKITGTSSTPTIFSDSGITYAYSGDLYLNTATSRTYQCVTEGNASTATWKYASSIKGSSGTSVTNIRFLYYLCTTTTDPTQPNGSTTIYTSSGANKWTTVISSYVTDARYYRSEEISYSDNTKTFSTMYRDYGLETANSTADDVSSYIKSTFTFNNNTFGPYRAPWNTDYVVAFTSTDKLLIGANSGIDIVNSDSSTTFSPALQINMGGITMNGASIQLRAESSSSTNSIRLNSNGIKLYSSIGIEMAAGNIEMSGGNISLTGGTVSITGSSGGSISFTDSNNDTLFSVTNGGTVTCKTLLVNGDITVLGSINGTNSTTQTTVWEGNYDTVSNGYYTFTWTGNTVSSGNHSAIVTVNWKNTSNAGRKMYYELYYGSTLLTGDSDFNVYVDSYGYTSASYSFTYNAATYSTSPNTNLKIKLYGMYYGSYNQLTLAGYLNSAERPQIRMVIQ